MKRIVLPVLLAIFLLVGCVVGPGRHGTDIVLVPALPSIVVLDEGPYYYYGGYYYYYQNDRWSYSNTRNGPWTELPRDRYPKEVRFKGRGPERDRGERRGHDEREGH